MEIVLSKKTTNKQTNKQTNVSTNKQTNKQTKGLDPRIRRHRGHVMLSFSKIEFEMKQNLFTCIPSFVFFDLYRRSVHRVSGEWFSNGAF